MAASVQGSEPSSRCARTTVENSQVRMISWACGRRSNGEHPRHRSGVALPAAGDLRGERRGGPGVHDVGLADEAAGHAALLGRCSRQARRCDGSTGSAASSGTSGRVVVGVAVLVEPVPQRDGHAEEALPRHQPVAVEALDPVLVAHLHVVGVPAQLAAAREQLLAQLEVASAVAQVPLAGGDDLERLVALLVELHRVRGRTRIALRSPPSRSEPLDHALLGGVRGGPGDGCVRLAALVRVIHVGGLRQQPAVPADDRAASAARARATR